MDYKYIEQLLERYWRCETTLEEEAILRTFFSQKDVPAALEQYRDLFLCELAEQQVGLGEDFDKRMISLVDEAEPVKARVITMTQRLAPLFKAAAVVAIALTLGNAAQHAFSTDESAEVAQSGTVLRSTDGKSVAMNDSVRTDTVMRSDVKPVTTILK